jgi:luciferase family oxidoreductase group 1
LKTKSGNPVRFAVVDFGWSVHATELVAKAEALGFERYWIGEHHTPRQTGNPLLLASLLAGTTERIRVGPAGICLGLHSPFAVAEDGLVLATMFGGRIDLGLCNGVGGDEPVVRALLDGRENTDKQFQDRVVEVAAHVGGVLPPGHPLEHRALGISYPERPEIWVMGQSERTAELAGRLGARFCFSEHHNALKKIDGPSIIAAYKAAFTPAVDLAGPHASVMVSGICAADDQAARKLLEATRVKASGEGAPAPFMSGGPATCRDYLERTAADFDVEEIAVLDVFFTLDRGAWTLADRERSLACLAEAALGSGV